MRIRILAVLLFATAASAGAQIIRPRFQLSQPTWWISLGAGYQQGWSVQNGSTNWDFADGPQFVASIEKSVATGASVGVAATTARVPVRVGAFDYNANVSQAFATLHISNGGQFHTSLDFRAGGTYYGFFDPVIPSIDPHSASPKIGGDTDFSFGLGYGIGYAFSPRFSVDVSQDLTTSIHQRDSVNPSGNASARANSTRLIARFGVGGR